MALFTLTLGAIGAGEAGADSGRTRLLTDFAAGAPVTWYTVNDGVMGGRSRGGFLTNGGVLVFAGSTNTNGGGFSSIRTREGEFDLQGFDGIRLRVKADGRRYTFRLTTSTTRQGRFVPSYWADFETNAARSADDWQVVDVPFSRFVPRWRGRTLEGPALDLDNIDTLGLMIYDKRDGPFRIEVDSIKAYASPSAFSMERYVGKRRPLLVFAPRADDARVVRQLAAIEKTRDAFGDRDMALIVVYGDGSTSTADGRAMTAAEVDTLRARYSIASNAFAVRLVGKDGRIKYTSADGDGEGDVVDPDDVYATIDDMPMRREEMGR